MPVELHDLKETFIPHDEELQNLLYDLNGDEPEANIQSERSSIKD